MEITINELLRLKNEVDHNIRLYLRGDKIVHGKKVYDDGREEVVEGVKSDDFLTKYNKAYDVSEHLHSVLNYHNHIADVGDIVRKKKNVDSKINFLTTNIIPQTTKRKMRSTVYDAGRNVVADEYTHVPFLSKDDVRASIKELKKQSRELQSKLDKINASLVTVNYTHEEIEELFV